VTSTMPVSERNKAVIRRLLEDVDRGELSAVDECFAADFVDHTPTALRGLAVGREGLKRTFAMLLEAFPDTVHTIEELIAEGDKVVARIHAKAQHTGALLGVAPTAKTIELRGIAIYRFAEGKIVERWSAHEGPGILEQIGMRTDDARRPEGTRGTP
jgi:steroid delta-isomerase-like uncharacterized protein